MFLEHADVFAWWVHMGQARRISAALFVVAESGKQAWGHLGE